MNNVKRKGIIADCIMAITQQLEMIKHICKDPMIDNECDLIVDYLDNITKPEEEREEFFSPNIFIGENELLPDGYREMLKDIDPAERKRLLEGEWNIPDEELEKSAELMKESIDKGILDDIADAAGFGGFTNDNPSTVDYDMLEDTQNPVDLDQANNDEKDTPKVDYQPDVTLQHTGEVIE